MHPTTKQRLKARLLRRLAPELVGRTDFPYRDYFDRHQCLFIHIPKSAGTSILSALSGGMSGGNYHRDHCTYLAYLTADGGKFKRYFKFAFSRHPLDRLVSTYKYLARGGNQAGDLWFKDLLAAQYPTFERFVLDYLNPHVVHEHVLLLPQYLYVFDHRHQLMVDHLGRFETINDDYRVVAECLGLPPELPHVNCSTADRPFMSYYTDPCVLERAVWLYEPDFDLLGYPRPAAGAGSPA